MRESSDATAVVDPSVDRALTDLSLADTAFEAVHDSVRSNRRLRLPVSRTAILGVVASAVISFGALGAASTMVSDPVLAGTPLSALRYGHGKMIALAAIYLGVALLATAWIRLGRHVRANTVDARTVLWTACAWALPLLACPPLFSKDVYSYLAQGALAADGFNPYQVGPSALPDLTLHENVHMVWQDTPAPYGPLHILLVRSVAALTGENVILGSLLIRLVFASGLVLLCAALPGLCRRLGARTNFALWFAVANPLTLVHLVGGVHNDALVIGLMAAGVLMVLERKHALGIALLTLAAAVKVAVIVVAPFLLWVIAAHRSDGTLLLRLAKATRLAALVFVPVFLVLTVLAGVDLGWIPALNVSSTIVNWMSMPTAFAQIVLEIFGTSDLHDRELLLSSMRTVGLVILVGAILWLWWRSREGGAGAIHRATVALMLVSLLLPATLPWYYTWAMALGSVLVWSRARLAFVAGAATWVVVSYYPTGETGLYDFNYVAVTISVAAVIGYGMYLWDPYRDEPGLVTVG